MASTIPDSADAKTAWVQRVLGVALPSGPEPGSAAAGAASGFTFDFADLDQPADQDYRVAPETATEKQLAATQLRDAVRKLLQETQPPPMETQSTFDSIDTTLTSRIQTFTAALERDASDDEAVAFIDALDSCIRQLLRIKDDLMADRRLPAALAEAAMWLEKTQTARAAWANKQVDEPAQQTLTEVGAAIKDLPGELEWLKEHDARASGTLTLALIIRDKASAALERLQRLEVAGKLGDLTGHARENELDTLAEQFGDDATPEHQALMRAIIAARFGVQFATDGEFANPLGGGIKQLKLLYDVMKQVPAAHLKAADGTMQISYQEAEPGLERSNKFAKRGQPGATTSTIVLTLPVDGEKVIKRNAIGTETELGFFQTTALHEIGHAVDDKGGFMKTNQGNPGFGKWKPSNAQELVNKWAEFVAGKVGKPPMAVARFVTDCLGLKPIKEPKVEADAFFALKDDWATLSPMVESIKSVRESRALWYKRASGADAAKLGDNRVYFEAYGGQFWSYDRSERDASVSDYQWRAPGEWFAEAYALYYSDKDKYRTHPIVALLGE